MDSGPGLCLCLRGLIRIVLPLGCYTVKMEKTAWMDRMARPDRVEGMPFLVEVEMEVTEAMRQLLELHRDGIQTMTMVRYCICVL